LVFRSSIAWLSDSLFTLRRASYPNPTQNSLPVAGQALPDGLSTRKVPMKGFKGVNYISFPFPKLAWRNGIDRRKLLLLVQFLWSDFSWRRSLQFVARSARRRGRPTRASERNEETFSGRSDRCSETEDVVASLSAKR
jgi:hypothetical protein